MEINLDRILEILAYFYLSKFHIKWLNNGGQKNIILWTYTYIGLFIGFLIQTVVVSHFDLKNYDIGLIWKIILFFSFGLYLQILMGMTVKRKNAIR